MKRTYHDIKFIKNTTNSITMQHLVGDITIPTTGGLSIAACPCGAGKSTAIKSLVGLFPDEGFAIFQKTKAECDEVWQKLIDAGISPSDIAVIYSGLPSDDQLKKLPNSMTKVRVLILPSVHLYTAFLPSLFAYYKGREIDTSQYIGDLAALFKSDEARKFVLIDEQPDFIQPFVTFDTASMLSHFGEINAKPRGGIKLDDKASNAFADFAGVTFLGDWQHGGQTLQLLNRNYGIKCSKHKLMIAAMIQTIARTRIRRHEGDKIVEYSQLLLSGK